MEQSGLIGVKRVRGKGRAVFALKAIKAGQAIETVPILRVPLNSLVGGMKCPELCRYFFCWDKRHVAISLGYGSLYNHSYRPNAQYRHGKMTITYFALRPIAAGEEITINYNGDPRDRDPVGFQVLEKTPGIHLGHAVRRGLVAQARRGLKSRSARKRLKRV